MASIKTPPFVLSSLAVFKNIINEELIRSIHVYRFEDGKEKGLEREFMFSLTGSYVEMSAQPVLKLSRVRLSELLEGQLIGIWLCILAFETDQPTLSSKIPSLLLISRNQKLKSIPTLYNDLQTVFQLKCRTENNEEHNFAQEEMYEEKKENHHHSPKNMPVFDQDLNCLPNPVDMPTLMENQENGQCLSELAVKKKKHRAAPEQIARLALDDLAKYFDLPILEASRNLKVGLTVLKRKCRELGIPRWPHRKIKSLDTLIHNLQEEADRQVQENKAAAMAVTKRQRMLESERKSIERKPFIDIQSETKRFRQDVFKRRHRARALLSSSSN